MPDASATMQRTIVDVDRLLEILNGELAARAECAGCVFTSKVTRLDQPYSDGGNWDRSLVVSGRPADPQLAGQTAADIISAVAAAYNLP